MLQKPSGSHWGGWAHLEVMEHHQNVPQRGKQPSLTMQMDVWCYGIPICKYWNVDNSETPLIPPGQYSRAHHSFHSNFRNPNQESLTCFLAFHLTPWNHNASPKLNCQSSCKIQGVRCSFSSACILCPVHRPCLPCCTLTPQFSPVSHSEAEHTLELKWIRGLGRSPAIYGFKRTQNMKAAHITLQKHFHPLQVRHFNCILSNRYHTVLGWHSHCCCKTVCWSSRDCAWRSFIIRVLNHTLLRVNHAQGWVFTQQPVPGSRSEIMCVPKSHVFEELLEPSRHSNAKIT